MKLSALKVGLCFALVVATSVVSMQAQHSASFGVGVSLPSGDFTNEFQLDNAAISYQLNYTFPLERTKHWNLSLSADLTRLNITSLTSDSIVVPLSETYLSLTPIVLGIRYNVLRPSREPMFMPFLELSAGLAFASVDFDTSSQPEAIDIGSSFCYVPSAGVRIRITSTIAADIIGSYIVIPEEKLSVANARVRAVYLLPY
jgi:hypothetical protein